MMMVLRPISVVGAPVFLVYLSKSHKELAEWIAETSLIKGGYNLADEKTTAKTSVLLERQGYSSTQRVG